MELNDRLAALLTDARTRTLGILAPFDDAVLRRQHDPLMSPLVWDLAHVANYEDLWLVRALGGTATRSGLDDLYDAFKQPRRAREALPLLGPEAARTYAADVRERALDLLARADLGADADPLFRSGFVHAMVVQHEHQHAETLLAAVQLLPFEEGHQFESTAASMTAMPLPAEEVLVAAGKFSMGSDVDWAYDNEQPPHRVDLPAFWIDAGPVTNGQYLEFIAAGGYDDERWWGEAGWAWRHEADLHAPLFWRQDGAEWVRARFGHLDAVDPREPVQHVCWHEADAYARWAGKRLPTETEWERAAAGAAATVEAANLAHHAVGRHPLGQRRLGPVAVGALPEGRSDVGCHQMLGDVWEWTASDFEPYPGFVAFPYDEYSAVFHGDGYKVLRGGSWATHPTACRSTFRNWDLPIRRQIFAGFRCARNAA